MVDELVGKGGPAFLWDDLHQVLFDLLRCVVVRQPQAFREPLYVGVHN